MNRLLPTLVLGTALMVPASSQSPSKPATEDPYLWLEDITGDKAMDFVRAANAATAKELEGTPAYRTLETDLLRIMDSKDKIPYVGKEGDHWYNFWTDGDHPRGLWRRTTLASYRTAHPVWETILDVDALGKAEGKGWVFHGASFLEPGCKRCLVSLSPGGSDAVEVREFDVETRSFVKDGFFLPVAKSEVSWVDADTVYVGTDFGPGSMTSSGYPRIVKVWKRGTPLSQAKVLFEAKESDMTAGAYHDPTKGFERDFVTRTMSFYTNETYLLDRHAGLRRVEVPDDAEPGVHRDWMTVKLRTAWKVGSRTYPGGSLLAVKFDDFMAGKRDFDVLFEPTATTSLEGYSWTRDHLILNVMDDVKNRITVLTPAAKAWKREPLKGAPTLGTVGASAIDPENSNEFFMSVTDFLTPGTLYFGTIGKAPEKLKSGPAFFEASGLEISQHFTTSKDGTRVPYFQVSAKGMKLDGTTPTLLEGYGGFEISELPSYSGVLGRAWLTQGGVFVVANIRGGGEYGPRWHQAALKANRPRAYEDFAAVAKDLADRKVTSPKHLGILGGSNGGLLMGNMITMYPELLGAVVCQVPLLDMKRYSHLLAGASWMAEYGDPDKPEEWAFIKTFSPYQNLKPGIKYPPTIFMTTTRDDRVHPGHARKMYAKMKDMGCDVRYFENTEGGHGAGADNRQSAHFWTLAYTFLQKTLR